MSDEGSPLRPKNEWGGQPPGKLKSKWLKFEGRFARAKPVIFIVAWLAFFIGMALFYREGYHTEVIPREEHSSDH